MYPPFPPVPHLRPTPGTLPRSRALQPTPLGLSPDLLHVQVGSHVLVAAGDLPRLGQALTSQSDAPGSGSAQQVQPSHHSSHIAVDTVDGGQFVGGPAGGPLMLSSLRLDQYLDSG